MLHCPTHDMLAYFFTKPLQGSLFKCLRRIIMGNAVWPNMISTAIPQEHVDGEKNEASSGEQVHLKQHKNNGHKITKSKQSTQQQQAKVNERNGSRRHTNKGWVSFFYDNPVKQCKIKQRKLWPRTASTPALIVDSSSWWKQSVIVILLTVPFSRLS